MSLKTSNLTKKEVIFYHEISMMGFTELHIVDGIIKMNHSHSASYIGPTDQKISQNKIQHFWNRMDEINIWKIKKKYPYGKSAHLIDICDGITWELRLRNKFGFVKVSSGYNSYPRVYKLLLKELNTLFDIDMEIY